MDDAQKLAYLERLHRVGLALSAESNRQRLLERILLEAKELCNADGGTLYLRTDDDHLKFAIMRTDSLNIAIGGTTGKEPTFTPVPLFDGDRPNEANVASYCAHVKTAVNIPDAYDTKGFDFSGTKRFDAANGYRSTSFLNIPMCNQDDHVIGVLQLLNAKSEKEEVIAFSLEQQEVVEALAAQAAVALDNLMLLNQQRELMESFIKLIAAAIDDKSPYTGGHCRRVPLITELLTKAVCDEDQGPFKDFQLNEDEWYELRIAAWLHDCGKVTTPIHVMDKATKLEKIYDRIEVVNTRFAVLAKEAQIDYLLALQRQEETSEALEAAYRKTLATLEEERKFLAIANIGGEFMSDDKKDRVQKIASRTWTHADGSQQPLLTEEEVYNLCISRGTLTQDERLVINGHMVQTARMLEALPFTRNLRRVPEYACGHHEKMDGTGYPKGLYAGDMSVPARIMAIADVFEALTAQDRPYKKGKTLSETMRIMGFMKRDNHLDPLLLDVFVKSGVYKTYAAEFLPASLIDEVDEEALLSIEPKEYSLPPKAERDERWKDFLPKYQKLPSL